MFLKELPVGSKGKIIGFGKEHPEYRRRLVMLGATPGTTNRNPCTRQLHQRSTRRSDADGSRKAISRR